jgi:hypothetical protein
MSQPEAGLGWGKGSGHPEQQNADSQETNLIFYTQQVLIY